MTRETFAAAVLENAAGVRDYKYGYDGRNPQGWCDCIGLIKGAYAIVGERFPDGSGVNWSARHDIDDLRTFTGIGELKVGDVVLKAYNPGEKGYNLPEKYKNDPDQKDYYHIGVVTSTIPFRITHCTTVNGGIKTDDNKSNWKYKGRFRSVNDGGGGERVIKAIVTAENKLPVNLRSQPVVNERTFITKVPLGAEVDILEEGDDWCKVKYNKIMGFMMTKFLIPVGEFDPVPPSDEPPDETEPLPPDEIPGDKTIKVELPESALIALWQALDGMFGKG